MPSSYPATAIAAAQVRSMVRPGETLTSTARLVRGAWAAIEPDLVAAAAGQPPGAPAVDLLTTRRMATNEALHRLRTTHERIVSLPATDPLRLALADLVDEAAAAAGAFTEV